MHDVTGRLLLAHSGDIGLRDDPNELVLANDDRDPSHLGPSHRLERVVQVVVRRHCVDLLRRDLGDACLVRIDTAPDAADCDVAVRDDPDQAGCLIDDRERPDILFAHQLRSFANGCLTRDRARPIGHHFSDLRSHGLLLLGFTGPHSATEADANALIQNGGGVYP